ncbi:MAG: hypothetical protein J7J52_05660, partial [Deltaproteobacteria bacterium]|nr:hypothetical protein [Deltaproteobacteria bacterium]
LLQWLIFKRPFLAHFITTIYKGLRPCLFCHSAILKRLVEIDLTYEGIATGKVSCKKRGVCAE